MSNGGCTRCGAPAVRQLALDGYCLSHLVELLRTFSPNAWGDVGVMLPAGPRHPEWGDDQYDCTCARCGATHIAAPLEACPWCIDSVHARNQHQRELLLTPPDVDPADQNFAAVVNAWGDRMERGILAGLITRSQADAVWRREARRGAA